MMPVSSQFAAGAGLTGLVESEHPPGSFPGAVVGELDRQELPTLAYDRSGDRHGVQWR